LSQKVASQGPVGVDRVGEKPQLRSTDFLEVLGRAHRHPIQEIFDDVGRYGCSGKKTNHCLETCDSGGYMLTIEVDELEASDKVDEGLSRFEEAVVNAIYMQLE
jgi:hypothetical protein